MGRNGNSRQLREGPYLLAISNDRCYFKEAPFSLENNNCIILAMLTGHETKNVRRRQPLMTPLCRSVRG